MGMFFYLAGDEIAFAFNIEACQDAHLAHR